MRKNLISSIKIDLPEPSKKVLEMSHEELENLFYYTQGKDICLIGNSKTILRTPKDIDSYDIVCRINQAFPEDKNYSKAIGTKTDVLFLGSIFKNTKKIETPFKVWSTGRYMGIKEKGAILFGDEALEDLRKELGSNPSTGCIAFYFIYKYLAFKSLTLYGFDFYKTESWERKGIFGDHDYKKEEQYVNGIMSKLNNYINNFVSIK